MVKRRSEKRQIRLEKNRERTRRMKKERKSRGKVD
jgi:hypothetical protein